MNEVTSTPKRSNLTLWILLASFLIPAFLAYGYYFFGNRPGVASNGQLITPIVDIESLNLKDPLGVTVSRDDLTPKWRMYYFVNESCDTKCENDLYNMRQINLALGKNADRVEHVIVHLTAPHNELMKLIENEHPTAVRVYGAIENAAELIRPGANDTSQYIYLMDPHGNVMMKFSNSLDAKLILKDINKLLKISRIG